MHVRLVALALTLALTTVFVGQRLLTGLALASATDPLAVAARADANAVALTARVEGDRLVVDTPRGTSDFVAGVNLGVTVPGHQPGELAVTSDHYRRWFARMDAYGIGVIRVYTIQQPHFYQELRRHNLAHPEAPIGVFHGVWVPDEPLDDTRDLAAWSTTAQFTGQITAAVRAVHGDAVITARPGRASGRYTADISPWLLGWLIGVEWDPEIVAATDRANADAATFRGRWFRAHTDATPTESWLARMLDHTADVQQSLGRQVPVSFVNWPTTDPLAHPDEPARLEDLVAIDANHVTPTPAWKGGYFVSYHAYPYFPDFLRHEPGLRRAGSEDDPYAGYLRALRRHHAGRPVVVAEFGVPSGPGVAHRGPRGRDQGDHSEQDAMRINADLLETIHDAGLAGGLLFEWIDEWFKLTWNTVDRELPAERRAKWFNPWTNESQFGLLASVPGARQPPITVDGDDREWRTSSATVLHRGVGDVREVLATHDEGYLYLLVRVADRDVWRHSGLTVGFDVLPGGARLPGGPPQPRVADTALRIGPSRDARLLVRASNNPYLIRFGVLQGYVAGVTSADVAPDSDRWDVQQLLLNRPIVVPTTRAAHGAEQVDIGVLRHGPTAPGADAFDARNMWFATDRTIEVRVPWAGVGMADPSSRRALRVDPDGDHHGVASHGIHMSVLVGDELRPLGTYTWPTWEQPAWHERPKRGVTAFTEALADVTRPRPRAGTSRALLAPRAHAGP